MRLLPPHLFRILLPPLLLLRCPSPHQVACEEGEHLHRARLDSWMFCSAVPLLPPRILTIDLARCVGPHLLRATCSRSWRFRRLSVSGNSAAGSGETYKPSCAMI